MRFRGWIVTSLAAGVLAALGSAVMAQPPAKAFRLQRLADFRPEHLTPFEDRLLRGADAVVQDEDRQPADNNSRGLILTGGSNAVVDFSVSGRKYGISLDGTRDVLIKNFTFLDRRSTDRFGSGIVIGSKAPTKGETFLSHAWIDLKEAGPEPDYKKANNEAISVEKGNAVLNIRQAVLIGAQESGIDNKGDVRMDSSFVASGHRSIRIWTGGSLVMANSIVLAYPKFAGVWFGGGKGVARLAYYNCLFGHVGDPPEALTSTLPDWMIGKDEDDPVDVRITKLTRDPMERGAASFWAPASPVVPPGYLASR